MSSLRLFGFAVALLSIASAQQVYNPYQGLTPIEIADRLIAAAASMEAIAWGVAEHNAQVCQAQPYLDACQLANSIVSLLRNSPEAQRRLQEDGEDAARQYLLIIAAVFASVG